MSVSLAHAVSYVASAPKSNAACNAVSAAMEVDYPEHYVKQQYLPDEIAGKTFYHPTDIGYERKIEERLKRLHDR